jgi:hypothetical protein
LGAGRARRELRPYPENNREVEPGNAGTTRRNNGKNRKKKMVHVQHYKDILFAKDSPTRAVFDDSPGTLDLAELASYLRACPEGIHLVLYLGGTPERHDIVPDVAACLPRSVLWEFADGDGEAEATAVLSALERVPAVSVQFRDGRITMPRLDLMCALFRDRQDRGLEFSAFNMSPAAFRDLAESLKEQSERFKTALVCVAAAAASPK